MSIKFIVRLKPYLAKDAQFRSQPGQGAPQTVWNSRQPTAAQARSEGAAVLGVNEDQVDVVSYAELDWSGSGDIIEMGADGDFK